MSEDKRTKSGPHPAVQAYREKLESVAEHTGAALDDLNADLDEFIARYSTPAPGDPDSGSHKNA